MGGWPRSRDTPIYLGDQMNPKRVDGSIYLKERDHSSIGCMTPFRVHLVPKVGQTFEGSGLFFRLAVAVVQYVDDSFFV